MNSNMTVNVALIEWIVTWQWMLHFNSTMIFSRNLLRKVEKLTTSTFLNRSNQNTMNQSNYVLYFVVIDQHCNRSNRSNRTKDMMKIFLDISQLRICQIFSQMDKLMTKIFCADENEKLIFRSCFLSYSRFCSQFSSVFT